jgi:hypothetical protein
MIAAIDRERLGKLLGMLGSEHDGEVVAAARAAEELRRRAKLTWPQILEPAPQPGCLPAQGGPKAVDEALALACAWIGALTEWEAHFVRTLIKQRAPASPKQREILNKICEKIQRRAR